MGKHKVSSKGQDYAMIPIPLIDDPSDAVRTNLDGEGMRTLADSILKLGLIEPLVVRSIADGRYEVVAGHRRLRACRSLGLGRVECRVIIDVDGLSDAVKLHENREREDLNVVDEAEWLARLMERTGRTIKEVAGVLRRSEEYVRQRLALNDLDGMVSDSLRSGRIGLRAARELNAISDADVRREYVRIADISGVSGETAKRWRDDFELGQARQAGDFERYAKVAEARGQKEILYPCEVCGDSYKISDTRFMRVCVNCVDALRGIAEAEKK